MRCRQLQKNYDLATSLGSIYLFNDPDAVKGGMAITYDKYAGRFAKIMTAPGMHKDHRPHDPRTTFITMAKKAGVDEYVINLLVGHKITDITEGTYTKRDLEWLRTEIFVTCTVLPTCYLPVTYSPDFPTIQSLPHPISIFASGRKKSTATLEITVLICLPAILFHRICLELPSLCSFFDGNSHSHSSPHHRVVAHTDQTHHLHMGRNGGGACKLGVGMHPS